MTRAYLGHPQGGLPAPSRRHVVTGQTLERAARPQHHCLVTWSLEVSPGVRAAVHAVAVQLGEHGELVRVAPRRVLPAHTGHVTAEHVTTVADPEHC